MPRFSAFVVALLAGWLSLAGVQAMRAVWLTVPGVQSGERPDDDMVLIPKGRAWVGCVDELDPDCEANEKAGRSVAVAAFEIDRTEVRVSDYQRCVRAGGCQPKGLRTPVWSNDEARPEYTWACNWGHRGRESHPINCVSWKQAVRYCRWVGKRLPTDAEWEKAARGGSAQIHPWGDEPLDPQHVRANVADESLTERYPQLPFLAGYDDGASATAPVGSYPEGASPDGLVDMIGNVEEWTEDRIPEAKAMRSIKGASWRSEAQQARVSQRTVASKNAQPEFAGFRCARSE